MELYLDRYLYRGNSLTDVHPKETLIIYRQYLKESGTEENSGLKNFLSKCAEVPDLNIKKFCLKYKIDLIDEKFSTEPYYVWQLAEEASVSSGRFGEPDPKLILQLILRGGEVPAEFVSAVNDFYEYYKEDQVQEFRIDDYVTSGYGINFCSVRIEDKKNQQIKDRITQVASTINKENQEKYLAVMDSYSAFIEEKIWSEEGNDGSGYITWALNSKYDQYDNILNLLEQVIKKEETTFPEKSFDELKIELDELLKKRDELLKINRIHGWNFNITFDGEQQIDFLWNTYKKQMFEFADAQFNELNALGVKKWIYSKRIEEIKQLILLYWDYQ